MHKNALFLLKIAKIAQRLQTLCLRRLMGCLWRLGASSPDLQWPPAAEGSAHKPSPNSPLKNPGYAATICYLTSIVARERFLNIGKAENIKYNFRLAQKWPIICINQ